MRIRKFPESNYSAVFVNGKTLRFAIDPTKPITELKYPEFYDIKITNTCSGNCPLCYMDSKEEPHYKGVREKLQAYFSRLNENQRPCQVALGGGNPNEHPEFWEMLLDFRELAIIPNYTTNGHGLTDEVLEYTIRYCGGVAITAHEHMEKVWTEAIVKFNSGISKGMQKLSIVPSVHRFDME